MIIGAVDVLTPSVVWDVSSLTSLLAAPRGVSSYITAESLRAPLKCYENYCAQLFCF